MLSLQELQLVLPAPLSMILLSRRSLQIYSKLSGLTNDEKTSVHDRSTILTNGSVTIFLQLTKKKISKDELKIIDEHICHPSWFFS